MGTIFGWAYGPWTNHLVECFLFLWPYGTVWLLASLFYICMVAIFSKYGLENLDTVLSALVILLIYFFFVLLLLCLRSFPPPFYVFHFH